MWMNLYNMMFFCPGLPHGVSAGVPRGGVRANARLLAVESRRSAHLPADSPWSRAHVPGPFYYRRYPHIHVSPLRRGHTPVSPLRIVVFTCLRFMRIWHCSPHPYLIRKLSVWQDLPDMANLSIYCIALQETNCWSAATTASLKL